MFIVNSLELYSQDIIVEDIRFGMKRAQAIFGMHTTLGGFSTMMAGTLELSAVCKEVGKEKAFNSYWLDDYSRVSYRYA